MARHVSWDVNALRQHNCIQMQLKTNLRGFQHEFFCASDPLFWTFMSQYSSIANISWKIKLSYCAFWLIVVFLKEDLNDV